MKLFFVLFIFTITTSHASIKREHRCYINLPEKFINLIPLSDISPKIIINKTNCPLAVQESFISVLDRFDNKVSTHYIENVFVDDFAPYAIEITPPIITKVNISQFLNSKLIRSKEKKLNEIRPIINDNFLILQKDDSIQVSSQSMIDLGPKNIKLTISNSNKSKIIWLNAELQTRVKILKSIRNLAAIPLTSKYFKEEFIYSSKPQFFFSRISDLKFYKLNRSITKNHHLTKYEISPLLAVKYGIPVNLIMRAETIEIKTKAYPLSNGRIGETITLKNNNKKIVGKIIDFNKVMVNL